MWARLFMVVVVAVKHVACEMRCRATRSSRVRSTCTAEDDARLARPSRPFCFSSAELSLFGREPCLPPVFHREKTGEVYTAIAGSTTAQHSALQCVGFVQQYVRHPCTAGFTACAPCAPVASGVKTRVCRLVPVFVPLSPPLLDSTWVCTSTSWRPRRARCRCSVSCLRRGRRERLAKR